MSGDGGESSTTSYSVTVCEIDLRVGGAWRFVGRGPEGQVPAFYGVYREIAPPERLVYTEIFEPFPDAESVVTQILTEEEGKTRLTVTASTRRSRFGTWCSRPEWRKARRSATTVSRTLLAVCGASKEAQSGEAGEE